MNNILLIAKKIGSTTVYNDGVKNSHATVLQVQKNVLIEKKNKEKHGYTSVVIGSIETKEKKINKPQLVDLKNKNLPFLPREIKEFRVADDCENNIGDVFELQDFMIGEFVDVNSVSKGKGFAGGMKRHGFAGQNASHGVSVTHRSIGSTGNRSLPGKVFKGKKMPGHMGSDVVTQQNMKVFDIDKDLGVIYLLGSVPGAKNSTVYIKSALKKNGLCSAKKINEKI